MPVQQTGSGATPHTSEEADTQSETLAPVLTMSNARSLAGGSQEQPRGGAGMDGDRRMERRRNGRSGNSPIGILTRLPAAVVLQRIPVPSLAIARDGTILFANTAFGEMVGYRHNTLTGLAFPAIFHTAPAAVRALSDVHALPNLVVELQHCEGWTVRARVSKSALMQCDDPVVLVTFEDLTERLWMTSDSGVGEVGSRNSRKDSVPAFVGRSTRG
jgi:PAS domain S-box-containing protein